MNVQRFAGDNEIMQLFAQQIDANNASNETTSSLAMNNAYQQRAQDVAATGVSNA